MTRPAALLALYLAACAAMWHAPAPVPPGPAVVVGGVMRLGGGAP